MRFSFFLILILFLASGVGLGAYEVGLVGGAMVDVPELWISSDSDPAVPTWYSPDKRCSAKIMFWEPGTYSDIWDFFIATHQDNSTGDVYPFPAWEDANAVLADLEYVESGKTFKGWSLFVIGEGPDVQISAVSEKKNFEALQPLLLSLIDSYTPSSSRRLYPGAVSQFLEYTDPDGKKLPIQTDFLGKSLNWEENTAASTAAQDVIEREARVLAMYEDLSSSEKIYSVWKRYYRMIYRDSYTRLDLLASALDEGSLPQEGTDATKAAQSLVDWMQGFTYGSGVGLSGILAPTTACFTQTGDCDTLGLALLMLLERYGVYGDLLLSLEARHALVALDLQSHQSATSDTERTWIVVELTADVPMGYIAENLRNVQWIPMQVSPRGKDNYR